MEPDKCTMEIKPEPHLDLFVAVSEIDRVLEAIESLRKRVAGEDSDEKSSCEISSAGSLTRVLRESPSLIREKIEVALARINDLTNLLY